MPRSASSPGGGGRPDSHRGTLRLDRYLLGARRPNPHEARVLREELGGLDEVREAALEPIVIGYGLARVGGDAYQLDWEDTHLRLDMASDAHRSLLLALLFMHRHALKCKASKYKERSWANPMRWVKEASLGMAADEFAATRCRRAAVNLAVPTGAAVMPLNLRCDLAWDDSTSGVVVRFRGSSRITFRAASNFLQLMARIGAGNRPNLTT